MHWQAFTFVQIVRNVFPEYFMKSRVVEFGSHTVNYSIRELFTKPERYLGVDLSAGNTVDVVAPAQEVNLGSNFDVAISCECFEHNPYFQDTFLNMYRHVAEHGVVIFTCATTGRQEHGTSKTNLNDSPGTASLGWDYYKNLVKEDFDLKFIEQNFKNYLFIENDESKDLYFIGLKKEITNADYMIKYIKEQVEACKRIGWAYNSFWNNHDEVKQVILALTLLAPTNGSPYLLEHSLPHLSKIQDDSMLEKLDSFVTNVYFQFSDNYLMIYLKALMEFKQNKFFVACSLLSRSNIYLTSSPAFKVYCDSLWEMDKKNLVVHIISNNLTLVLEAAEWMKVNFVSQLIDTDVIDVVKIETLKSIVDSSKNNLQVKGLYARYFFRLGLFNSAIDELELLTSNSKNLPQWIFNDLERYKKHVLPAE